MYEFIYVRMCVCECAYFQTSNHVYMQRSTYIYFIEIFHCKLPLLLVFHDINGYKM
jgi:hypothetical protein